MISNSKASGLKMKTFYKFKNFFQRNSEHDNAGSASSPVRGKTNGSELAHEHKNALNEVARDC